MMGRVVHPEPGCGFVPGFRGAGDLDCYSRQGAQCSGFVLSDQGGIGATPA